MVNISGLDNHFKDCFLELYSSINDYQLRFTYNDGQQVFNLNNCKKLIFKKNSLLIVFDNFLELFFYEYIDNFKLFKV